MKSSICSHSILLVSTIVVLSSQCGAFQVQQQPPTNQNCAPASDHATHTTCDGRRNFLSRGAGAAMSVLVGGLTLAQPAEASYSAFAAREKDWTDREKKGEVKISNASQLRAQLQEIAPMNNEGSKIFCPNGASSAVTPLMENKCGDRLALPSVYGRTDDAMGNSIPGFVGAGGKGANAATLRAELDAMSSFRAN